MKKFIKKIKSNKFLYILSVLIVGIFFILIAKVTYAFLAPIINNAQTNIVIKGDTVDEFKLKVGNPLKLDATPTTLKENGTNYTTSTTATVSLKANSTKNTATYNYYLYFQIENNTFTYTSETTPEIILTITNPNGEEVTSIEGLTYGTFNGVSGFDVTTQNGLFNIANNYSITSNSSTTATIHEWTVTLTYLNQAYDQSGNFGKSMEVGVLLQKEEVKPLLADYVKSLYVSNKGENGIYYHDATLTNGAGDNSYRYAGGDSCTFNNANVQGAYSDATFGASNETDCQKVYTIKSDAITLWTDNSITRLLSDEKPVTWTDGACKTMNGESINIGFVDGKFNPVTEATCKEKSYLVKTDKLTARVANLNMEYVGVGTWNSVNNFVCFGTNTTPCPTDNLYRIIGVFGDKVKLIKSDYATSTLLGADGDYSKMYTANNWDNSSYKGNNLANIAGYTWNYKNNTTINNGCGSNTWSTSLLNKTNLNKNFITNIGADWAAKIDTTTWKVGGNTSANIYSQPAKIAYQNEIVSPVTTNTTDNATTFSAKVGLMYASDYGYAAAPRAWTANLNTYNDNIIKSVNWMYMGLFEWTISRFTDNAYSVFDVTRTGDVNYYFAYNALAVRPVFNLTSSVNYVSGSGSATDPIVVN